MQAPQQPLVSVVITAYNQADLLKLTIDSILSQTYKTIETIVINDGSADHTAAVLASYGDKIIAVNQENQGASKALLNGLNLAKGDYITIIDHDDLMMPTKTEKQVQLLEKQPKFDVVHCGYFIIDMDGNVLDRITFLPDGDILKDLVSGNFIWSGAPLMRRQCVIDNLDVLDNDVWTADTDFWIRLAIKGHLFACIQEPLGSWRLVPGSTVTKTHNVEVGAIEVLDHTFSNPLLPADVLTVKNKAYATKYFWLSYRYYRSQDWENAQRTLTKALELDPELIIPPEKFLHHINGEAINPYRLDHPVEFLDSVLDHLPAAAASLGQHRNRLQSIVHMGMALLSYSQNNTAEGRKHIQECVSLAPKDSPLRATFSQLVIHYALHLPLANPFEFVELVFNNLPPEAEHLKAAHNEVLSSLHITQAFLDYSSGQYMSVVNHVMGGVWRRPQWLKNKGVVSIFAKSFFAGLPLQ